MKNLQSFLRRSSAGVFAAAVVATVAISARTRRRTPRNDGGYSAAETWPNSVACRSNRLR